MQKVFLIICTGYFGDLILTSKLTRDIKKFFTDSKVIYICDSPYVTVAKNLPGVDEVIPYSRKINLNLFKYLSFIFKFPYLNKITHAFIIHQNKRSRTQLAKALGSKGITNWDMFRSSDFNQDLISKDVKYEKVAYLNANMLSVITKKVTDDRDIEFIVPQEAQQKIDELLSQYNYENLVAINPQAGDDWKCWGEDKIRSLMKQLIKRGYTPVLTGVSKDGIDYLNSIKNDNELNESSYINMVDKTSFLELGALYKRCKAVVSVETGSAHVSAAVGTPTVVLFFKDNFNMWAPLNLNKNLYIYGAKISAEEVFSKVESLLLDSAKD